MPKEINNDKRFLKFAQKKLKLTKKQIAESEIWIDGFKNAVESCQRVGLIAKWKRIPEAHEIVSWPVFVLSNNDGMEVVDIAWFDSNKNEWVYPPVNTNMYKTPTHYAEIELPQNTPLSKQYKHLNK
jgi:hypothetical protein